MANRKVSLVRRVRLDGRWRYLQPIISDKDRTSPTDVKLNGGTARVLGGVWYLSWREGSSKKRRAIGPSLTEAVAAKWKQEQLMAARNAGVDVQDEPGGTRLTIDAGIELFLERVKKKQGSRDRVDIYTLATKEFRDSCKKRFVDQILRDDVLNYLKYLRRATPALAPRTIVNRWAALCAFLRSDILVDAGLKVTKVINKDDKPRHVKKKPRAYSDAEIQRLWLACDEYARLVFETLLKTGFRYRELATAEWSDVSFDDATIRVTAKEHWDFTPKDLEERIVPLEDSLLAKLKAWRVKHPETRLIFGTANDRPNRHWLPMLKNAARQAGLNCGYCNGCFERNECSHYLVHRFRATFVTKMLRQGEDLSNVMALSGHSDLKSVKRYIEPGQGTRARKNLNVAFAAL